MAATAVRLMELQSSVDRLMRLRLGAYVMLLYQYLVKQKLLTPSRLLPPVLPVVLYNGEEPWWAPRSLAELIQPLEGLALPSFEYVVLDVGHYPVEELRPVRDVASGVFLMEQAVSFAELETVLDEVSRLVVGDPRLEECQRSLWDAAASLFRQSSAGRPQAGCPLASTFIVSAKGMKGRPRGDSCARARTASAAAQRRIWATVRHTR